MWWIHKAEYRFTYSYIALESWELTKNESYMGVWQLLALSSVLQADIFSVYPQPWKPWCEKQSPQKNYLKEQKLVDIMLWPRYFFPFCLLVSVHQKCGSPLKICWHTLWWGTASWNCSWRGWWRRTSKQLALTNVCGHIGKTSAGMEKGQCIESHISVPDRVTDIYKWGHHLGGISFRSRMAQFRY